MHNGEREIEQLPTWSVCVAASLRSTACWSWASSTSRPIRLPMAGVISIMPMHWHVRSQLIDEGADIIDIGGESTRPVRPKCPPDEEIRRVRAAARGAGAQRRFHCRLTPASPRSCALRWLRVLRSSMTCGRCSSPARLEAVAEQRLRCSADAHAGHAAHDATGAPLSRRNRGSRAVSERRGCNARRAQGIDVRRIAVDPGFGFGKSDRA